MHFQVKFQYFGPVSPGERALGPDGGGTEEAAEGGGPAAHQPHEGLLHRQGPLLRVRPRGDEVQHAGAALLQHPRRGRDPGGAQDKMSHALVYILPPSSRSQYPTLLDEKKRRDGLIVSLVQLLSYLIKGTVKMG